VMPAPGAKIEAMVERIAVDQFRREGGAFVLGVTGLPADAAPLLALRRCRLGRLDDVGGRRLGRGRGILPRRGELLLETSDGALEHLHTRLLGVQLRLQAPTVRARLPCLGSHDGLCYILGREYTTPVNGYLSQMPELIIAERIAVQDLYFMPRADLAFVAFLFPDWQSAEIHLIQECDEARRWAYFRHHFALANARRKVIIEHLATH